MNWCLKREFCRLRDEVNLTAVPAATPQVLGTVLGPTLLGKCRDRKNSRPPLSPQRSHLAFRVINDRFHWTKQPGLLSVKSDWPVGQGQQRSCSKWKLSLRNYSSLLTNVHQLNYCTSFMILTSSCLFLSLPSSSSLSSWKFTFFSAFPHR
jgi:hypothetical protein